MADYRTLMGEYAGARRGGLMGNIDFQPIVIAVAALIVACTPPAVALLNARVSELDHRLPSGQARIHDRLDALPAATAAAIAPTVAAAVDQAAAMQPPVGESK